MRIAALYDVHGNLPALEAVLDDVRALGVDHVVIGGDVVPGPMPGECLALLRSLDVSLTCIKGNCEAEVLGVIDGRETGRVPERFMGIMRWSAAQLSGDQVEWIRSWPATLVLGEALFCHATPRDDNEVFVATTPAQALERVFADCPETVVCGHTHMQFDRAIGPTRVVNAGSVGSPYGRPGAYWALVDGGVELRRTEYDFKSAAARISASEYPEAVEFARESVLAPADEATMVATFSKFEIR